MSEIIEEVEIDAEIEVLEEESGTASEWTSLFDGSSFKINYPTLAQAANGDIILAVDRVDYQLEDGSQIINIYTSTSINNGTTWSIPEKQTNYDTFGTIGYHPDLAPSPYGGFTLAYTEKKNVLTMDGGTNNFQSACGDPGSMVSAEIQFDSANNKLYVLGLIAGAGIKRLCFIMEVDVPTWSIDRCYTTETVPAFHPYLYENHVWTHNWIGQGQHTIAASGKVFMVCHHDTKEVVTYVINDDIPEYLLTANIDIDFGGHGPSLAAGWIDEGSERLYLYLYDGYLYHNTMWLGYIDIHQQPNPTSGKYTWHPIITKYLHPNESRITRSAALGGFNFMQVVPEIDYIILGYQSAWRPGIAGILIFQISSGGVVKHYNWNDYPGFPIWGVLYPHYYNGHIYAGLIYESGYNNQDRRGLMDLNLLTEEIQYIVPSFATADNYGLYRKKTLTNGRILMTSDYGPCIYDTIHGTWELFSTDTLPGLPANRLTSYDYDPLTGTIFAAGNVYQSGFAGIVAWNEQGDFRQGQYMEAELAADWEFGEVQPLNKNLFDYENSITIDPRGSLWSMWTRRDLAEYSIKWDKEGASLNLKDYLVRGSSVQIEWHVDGINKLSFQLSHGHLFDPLNTMSALSNFVQKGRRISVFLGENAYFGEEVYDPPYLVNQGEFLVMSTKVGYKRGEYPTISVDCEDYRTMWNENRIVATPYYGDLYPETVIENLLTEHGRLATEDISIPTLAHRHLIYCQFLDDTLDSVLKEILDHFQAFALVGPDGVFTVRQIDLNAAPDHEYTDSKQMIRISPDDEFSSFVNRVVVKGEGRYEIEVLYNAESVASLSGTTGWWGKKIKEKVWYSEDHERTCRDPELEIIQSVRDFHLFGLGGGGTEYVSDVDITEMWVEITIESPNLVGVVIGLAAAIVGVGSSAVGCLLNCGPFILALSLLTSALFYVMATVASYSYNVWARPIGHEKQQFQAEANDLELQRYLNGNIITDEIEDQFCYTVAECQRIANYELSIVQAQRKRLEVEKIGHLQDQVGDIIRVIHPYSQTSLKMFVTDLTRSYTVPEKNLSDSGGLIDRLTGWRLISG